MAEKGNSFIPPKGKRPKFSFYWIYAILAIIFIAIQYFNYSNPVQERSWNKLEEMLKKQDIEKLVVINKEKAEIYIKKDKLKSDTAYKEFTKRSFGTTSSSGPEFFYQIGSVDIFYGLLKDTRDSIVSQMKHDSVPAAQILEFQEQYPYPPSTDSRKDIFGDIFSYLLPIIVLIGAWFLIMRFMSKGGGGGGQIFNIGKSKAQLFDKDTSVSITFNDVAGLEEAKVEIMEIVDFLKNPSKYTLSLIHISEPTRPY